jgi:hypothetical protein
MVVPTVCMMSSLCGSLMTTQRMFGNGNVLFLLLPLLFLGSTAVCRSQETHPPLKKTHWLGNECCDEQQDSGISSHSGTAGELSGFVNIVLWNHQGFNKQKVITKRGSILKFPTSLCFCCWFLNLLTRTKP